VAGSSNGGRHQSHEAHVRAGRAGSHEAKVKAGRIGGPIGARNQSLEAKSRGGHAGGQAASISGQLASARAKNARPSKLQLQIAYLLFHEFPSVIIEAPFDPYRVDIYLPPPYHLGFEVDGTYWHKDRDSCRRDKYLLETFRLPIAHLSEAELNDALRKARTNQRGKNENSSNATL
jgi:hypothetical protein